MWTAVVDIAVIKERGGEATCVNIQLVQLCNRAEGEERRNVLIWMGINWWGHTTINHVRIKKLNRQWDVLKGQAIK